MRVATRLAAVIADFLAGEPTSKEIIAHRFPPALEARATDLLERMHTEDLNAEEQAELEEFAQVNQQFAVMQARAELQLKAHQ